MLETFVFSIVIFATDVAAIAYDHPNFSEVVMETKYRRRPPRYPFSCTSGKKSGTVDITSLVFDIETNGRPTNIRIVDATDGCFNRVARKAISGWRYTKPTYQGAPVKILNFKSKMTFTSH